MADDLLQDIECDDLDIIKSIIKSGVSNAKAFVLKKDQFGFTALHYAVKRSDFEFVKFFIESGSDVSAKTKYGDTALHHASRIDNLEIVKLLVSSGCNILEKNVFRETALHYASLCGHFDIVKFLVTSCIDTCIDIDVKDNIDRTPIDVARKKEIKEFLIKQLEIQKNGGYILK